MCHHFVWWVRKFFLVPFFQILLVWILCFLLTPTFHRHILLLIFVSTLMISGQECKVEASLNGTLQSPATSSLLWVLSFRYGITVSFLFANTLKFWFFLTTRDQVTHPYKIYWCLRYHKMIVWVDIGRRIQLSGIYTIRLEIQTTFSLRVQQNAQFYCYVFQS
jgi:hypothetical protein